MGYNWTNSVTFFFNFMCVGFARVLNPNRHPSIIGWDIEITKKTKQ